jgi:hypothetical protein
MHDMEYSVGSTSSQQREPNESKFTIDVAGGFDVVMVVIPTDIDIPVRAYRSLIDGLDKSIIRSDDIDFLFNIFLLGGLPFVPVLTGTDLNRSYSVLLSSLNLPETQVRFTPICKHFNLLFFSPPFSQVLKIVPYSARHNSTYNSATNLQALQILHRVLDLGDAEVPMHKSPITTRDLIILVLGALALLFFMKNFK